MTRLTALFLVLLAACASEAPETACDTSALTAHNAIFTNAISFNALSMNALTLNSLSASDIELSCAPESAKVYEYLVGCALAPDQSTTALIDGAETELHGALGLAPEWLDGPCDDDCQGWVSACLIARTNARGERVEISLRGAHPGLALEPGEAEAFPDHEGSYYGDVFAGELDAMACLGDGVDHLERTCGDSSDCPIAVQGTCAELCDESGCRDAAGALHHAIEVYRAR